MKKTILAISFVALIQLVLRADPLGTAFTYQGQLNNNGAPASGAYDFRFSLFDGASNSAAQVGATVPLNSVAVVGGLFTATLDFGTNIFDGPARWLDIAVRANNGGTNANGNFSALSPRQPLTPAPYALFAPSAGVAAVANGVSSSTIIQGQSLQVGINNILAGIYGTISGGASNTAGGDYAAVAGGFGNTAISNSAAIGGGSSNTADGDHALVAGGEANSAVGDHAVVGGGAYNRASGYDIVGGGLSNSVSADYSGSFCGQNNNVFELSFGGGVTAHHSFIGGGLNNSIRTPYGMVGGGANNSLNGGWATITGGARNQNNGDYGVISGGSYNTNHCTYGSIGGGSLNLVNAPYSATVAGGYQNAVSGQDATIGGGSYNSISDGADYSALAGGSGNFIGWRILDLIEFGFQTNHAYAAVLNGGLNNTNIGYYAALGGGQNNTIVGAANNVEASHAVLAGGLNNKLIAQNAGTIGGGRDNVVQSDYAVVPGGRSASPNNYGQFAFAAGHMDSAGDAQASTIVLRRKLTVAADADLFLNGDNGDARVLIPPGAVWTLRFQISGVSLAGTNFGSYEVSGVIAKIGTTTTFRLMDGSGATVTTARPIYETPGAVSWQATPRLDADGTLRVEVFAAEAAKWCARIDVAEVRR